jgi:glycosyltransferase involved in cell wall biosynthesis
VPKRNDGTSVLLYEPSSGGGVAQYTDRLASSLVLAGLRVAVATPDGSELTKHHRQYRLVLLGKRLWLKKVLSQISAKPRQIRSLQELCVNQLERTARNAPIAVTIWSRAKFILAILREQPHIVHFQWLTDPTEEYYFMKLLRLWHIMLVYTAHNLLPHDDESDYSQLRYQRIYRLVDTLIVHSERSRDDMVRRFHIQPDKIAVIPHGAYDSFFESSRLISGTAARRELDIPDDRAIVLFFGLIRRYKGLEYLIEAFAEVKVQVENAMLLIAGDISRADSEDFRYYETLLETLDGRDDVRRISRSIPDNQVGSLFVASDLVVLPYVKTDTSGVLLAAYAAGKPVVATDTGALGEIVEPGKTGLLVPPRDSRALALAIITMLQDGNALRDMGRYAKHLADTSYSWHRVAAQTRDVYQSVMSRAPSRGPARRAAHPESAG